MVEHSPKILAREEKTTTTITKSSNKSSERRVVLGQAFIYVEIGRKQFYL